MGHHPTIENMQNLEIAKKLFNEAIKSVENGELEVAERKLIECYQIAPTRESVLINLIKVQLKNKKINDATKYIKLYETNGHKDVNFLEEIAEIFNYEKKFYESANTYKKILKIKVNEKNLINYFQSLVTISEYKLILEYESLAPKNNLTLQNYIGIAYAEMNNEEKTKEVFDYILELNPNEKEIKINYAIALTKLKKNEEACRLLKEIMAIDSKNKRACIAYSKSLEDMGDNDEAILLLENWHERNIKDIEIIINLSHLYIKNNKYKKSIEIIEKEKKIFEKDERLLVNLGTSYLKIKNYNEALKSIEKALLVNNKSAFAWLNKGAIQNELNRYEEAEKCYLKALNLKENFHEATWNLSLLKLKLKEFKEGFNYFEARWLRENTDPYLHKNIKKLENLEDAKNKKILVWCEQGHGDSIQFSRYLKYLKELNINAIFEVNNLLYDLFKNNFDNVIDSEKNLSKSIDYQIPLLSLPRLLNIEYKNIKNDVYIKADSSKQNYFKRIILSNGKKNIGIAVSGNKNYDERNGNRRQIPLCKFNLLANSFNLYLVQKEISNEDKLFLEANTKIIYCKNYISTFDDTAAIIANMDHIISIDTSLAHLAGSMGLKTEVLLPWCADWRWFHDEKKSSWYKNLNLWRQVSLDDWSILEKVHETLKENYE